MTENYNLGLRISFLYKLIHNCMEEQIKAEEFTGAEGRVLHYLLAQEEAGDIFQKDIEKEFRIKRSTASEILSRLEAKEYIQRVPSERDARLKKLVLLSKARILAPNVHQSIDLINEALSKDIPAEELNAFLLTLEKMIGNMTDGGAL